MVVWLLSVKLGRQIRIVTLGGVGLNRHGCVASLHQTGETDPNSDFRGGGGGGGVGLNRHGCVGSLRQTGETDQNSDLRGVGLNRQGCVASLRQTGETDQNSDFRGGWVEPSGLCGFSPSNWGDRSEE